MMKKVLVVSICMFFISGAASAVITQDYTTIILHPENNNGSQAFAVSDGMQYGFTSRSTQHSSHATFAGTWSGNSGSYTDIEGAGSNGGCLRVF